MKYIFKKLALILVLCISFSLFAVGCGGGNGTETKDFTGIEFNNATINYDGEEHTIVATGVPQGATVNYTNAGPHKNAGEYTISVSVSASGYNTYTKSVKLTINKIDFPSSIVFEDKTEEYTGSEKTILISGDLPEGTQVQYTNNKGTEVGTYQASATLTNPNYKSKTLQATLTILSNETNDNFTGIEFDGITIDYDGEEHTIVATGVPQGATVNYTNAGPHKNAGEYTITVSVSASGYNTYTKSVKLTINKIDFPSSIVFEDKKEFYNGCEKTILISGDLPEGTQVQYVNNKGTEIGSYQASATLTNPNYKTKTLQATLTITENLLSVAKNTIDTILDRPDPWSFMPKAFSRDKLACTSNPVKSFSSFVNVNDINKKFMGKQMYVFWEGVDGMESLLSKFDVVYAVGETIATVYQNFINDNPNNYAVWSDTVAGFKVKIVLDNNQSKMLVGNNAFSLELFADTKNNVNRGRIEVANGGGILNYEMKDNYLKFNVSLSIKGVMAMKQIEFVRNSNGVKGKFYEYLGAKNVAVKTSAVIAFDDDYAIVMSAKRESEDLIIEGYEEVYSSTTGQFLGAKVVENNKLVDFDTFWVNLYDVTGIINVKAIPNDKISLNENIHDIYVNNSSNIFKPAKNKILLVETSRKFDIEMKTVYYVTKTTNGDEVKYQIVETEIPMLFVQKDNVSSFGKDIVDENKNTFESKPVLPSSKISVADTNFASLQISLNAMKENLTYDQLVAELGKKDSFFN